MNIIDSLVVTLGLDASGFLKGQKDAEAAQGKLGADSVDAAKKVEAANAKAGESVAALGRKFIGLYVLLTAGKGVKEFVSDITAADAALGRTARNLDMSGRSLSAWQNAATVAGGSAEGITGTLKGLTGEMQRAALTGQSSIIPVFRSLGINLADARGKARDAGDVLKDLADRFQGMDPARASALGHMAGLDDGTINLLEKGRAAVEALLKEEEKYAATAKDIDAAQQRQTGWRQLLITSSSLGRTILTSLTPAITGATQAIQRWADANQEWLKGKVDEYAERIATWVKSVDWGKVATDVGTFVSNVGAITGAVASAVRGVDGGSALSTALTALGVLAGVTLVGRFAALTKSIGSLSAIALPGWFVKMAGLGAAVAVGAVAESTPDADTQKRMDDFYKSHPDASANPFVTVGKWWKANAATWLGGDGPEAKARDADLDKRRQAQRASESAAEAKNPSTGSFWGDVKRYLGFGDDPKVKENVEATAKATGEMRDLMKAQRDGLGVTSGPEASNGGAGGNIANLRYGRASDGKYRGTPGSNAAGGGEGGSRSWRNNNPGNISAGKWATTHGADGSDGRFAHFPSYESGRKAQEDLWFNSDLYKGKTLAGAVTQWSPPNENDTAGLIRRYAAAAGVDPNTPLSQFSAAQRGKLLDAQQSAEGWRSGQRTTSVNPNAPGSTGPGDIVGKAEGMVGLREGEAAKALKHIMHAGEWCADFVNGTIEANGGKGSGSAMARSFLNWGKAVGVGQVKRGDVAVLNNGGHVGFFTGERRPDGRLGVIAGNTRDGRGGHDVEHYFVDPNSVTGARRGAETAMAQSLNTSSPTYGHAIHHALGVMAHANAMTRHDDKPIPVTYVDKNGVAPSGNPLADLHKWRYDFATKHHAAALDRMTRMAASGGGSTVHHTVNHMDTRIGEMNVLPKGDGKQFAGEFHGMVSDRARRGDVVQANGALAAVAWCAILLPWLTDHGISASLNVAQMAV